jgi:hypothetical protein
MPRDHRCWVSIGKKMRSRACHYSDKGCTYWGKHSDMNVQVGRCPCPDSSAFSMKIQLRTILAIHAMP